MKKIWILTAVALITAPVFAAGVLANKEIPVVMTIDKTVTLTVSEPRYIELHILDPNKSLAGDAIYANFIGVIMTHNFPVIVNAIIVPFGPSLGPVAVYKVALAKPPNSVPQTATDWIANGTGDDTLNFNTPAPPPVGELFYVGAAVLYVDLTYAPSSPTAVQVATVGLTVTDNL
jgi:hypothetical protein